MSYYKAPDNSLHFIEPDFAHMLPAGSVPITEAEAAAIRIASTPVQAHLSPQEQIAALEQEQFMPRATREFMLLAMDAQFTPEQLALNPGYQAVKAFDNIIKDLRAQIP
jgi:hypothetical protein